MIEIYATGSCQYCKDAKALCIEKDIPYYYHLVDVYPDKLEELEDRIGKRVRQVPQIFMDDEYVGGYTELREKLNG